MDYAINTSHSASSLIATIARYAATTSYYRGRDITDTTFTGSCSGCLTTVDRPNAIDVTDIDFS